MTDNGLLQLDRPASITVAGDTRRGRILSSTLRGPLTLSEIERRVGPDTSASRKDRSIHRIKTTSAIRALKRDGLLARSPWGWVATAAGVQALQRTAR
jgi:hypothetical protein